MLAAGGVDMFEIGNVHTSRYRDVMTHPTVRALVLASIREAQPDCVSCTYAPYCGIQPEHNLRGRFETDAQGRFHFRTVRPAGYPVPTDGPCGEMLRALAGLGRRPNLAAIEIVEYIPELDEADRTAHLVRDLLIALLAPERLANRIVAEALTTA